jgi:hypothetical protein
MAIASGSALIEVLLENRLIEPDQAEEINHYVLPRFSDPAALAKELVRKGWLTVYQVNQLLQGNAADLWVGPCWVLDRLGDGGICQVFKAWHTGLNRLVALKVLRPEHLSNTELLGRFQREMRAVARLDHPNLVRAVDADPEANRDYFCMEYVEGTDLGKVVKLTGPMGVSLACDCVRQAALGSQHAFENGIIHRDFKPANLLLNDGSVIKVLDMGLARFVQNELEILTQGTIGSPDYLSPEQARDSHAVDVRADIYSLGATLYYCLTGVAPFEDAKTIAQKLMALQTRLPRPIRSLRANLDEGVIQIVETMMAKDPAQRYATPADVAKALSPLAATRASLDLGSGVKRRPPRSGSSRDINLAAVPAAITALGQAGDVPAPPLPAEAPAAPEREAAPAPAGSEPGAAHAVAAAPAAPVPADSAAVGVAPLPAEVGVAAVVADAHTDPGEPAPAVAKSRWGWPVVLVATALGGALLVAALKLAVR